MSIKMSVELRNISVILTGDYKHTSKIYNFFLILQNIKFLTTYCFVFLPQMQPGGLFQVNETTNVFFMILRQLRDCFIS